MALSKLFFGALDTVTGILQRSSSMDRRVKEVASIVRESDSLKSMKNFASTVKDNANKLLHNLDGGRPHSAGPYLTGHARKRLPNKLSARRSQENNMVLGAAKKSSSILYRVAKLMEGSDIQHPIGVLKKSSNKPVILKVPIMKYGPRVLEPIRTTFFRNLAKQPRDTCYKKMQKAVGSYITPRSHKSRSTKQRAQFYYGGACSNTIRTQMHQRIQGGGKIIRSVEKSLQEVRTKNTPTAPMIQASEKKVMPTECIRTQVPRKKTLQPRTIRQSPRMKFQPLKAFQPKIIAIPKETSQLRQVMFQDKLLINANPRKIEMSSNKFPTSIGPSLIPSNKEKIRDIMRQYEHALKNTELPSYSEITDSLYTSQRALKTGFKSTDAWLKEIKDKKGAIILRRHPDLITILESQPNTRSKNQTVERKRPPIITVPVTVVNVTKNKNTKNGGRKY